MNRQNGECGILTPEWVTEVSPGLAFRAPTRGWKPKTQIVRGRSRGPQRKKPTKPDHEGGNARLRALELASLYAEKHANTTAPRPGYSSMPQSQGTFLRESCRCPSESWRFANTAAHQGQAAKPGSLGGTPPLYQMKSHSSRSLTSLLGPEAPSPLQPRCSQASPLEP